MARSTDPSLSRSAVGIDRPGPATISERIAAAVRRAILDGSLPAGARLPSGRDLSVQLGVARGTVRSAFERLIDEGLIFSAGAGGTLVATRASTAPKRDGGVAPAFQRPLDGFVPSFSSPPLPFQLGVPANDAFPAKVWARLRTRALRRDSMAPLSYADPRGEPELRAQIARQLAIGRDIDCVPDQVIVTGGYRQGLSLVLTALQVRGRSAWMEEPGFPIGRRALEYAGLSPVPVPVDADGIRVPDAVRRAPDAAVALVTPGKQAPLGAVLTPRRRRELLAWAGDADSWILEDDYLSELELDGRAAPALASGGGARRVVHIGTFSKTLGPAFGLGFIVSPPSLVDRIADVAAITSPAPNRTTQFAVAEFLADGHYLRHLRRMKALYRARRDLVRGHLAPFGVEPLIGGLAMLLRLPGLDDAALAARALARGMAPAPLSAWYIGESPASSGLMLGVTNMHEGNIEAAGAALRTLLDPR